MNAYLIAIFDKDQRLNHADIWSSPEWEQSRCLPDKWVFVAYQVQGKDFAEARKVLLETISKPECRYNYLWHYLPWDERLAHLPKMVDAVTFEEVIAYLETQPDDKLLNLQLASEDPATLAIKARGFDAAFFREKYVEAGKLAKFKKNIPVPPLYTELMESVFRNLREMQNDNQHGYCRVSVLWMKGLLQAVLAEEDFSCLQYFLPELKK